MKSSVKGERLRPSRLVSGIAEAMSIRFNTLVYEAKRRNEDVIVLSLGEAYFDIPLHSLDDLPFPDLYHYSHSRGLPQLRTHLAGYFQERYGVAFDAEKECLITAGSKVAIYMALLAVLDPNDEAVVLEPAWVSYSELIKLCRGTPVMVPHDTPISGLSRYLSPQTKVVIINNPNNPSGKVYSHAELAHLYELARKHDFFILSDEAYSDFFTRQSDFISMGKLDTKKTHTLLVNSCSKNLGMSGWRLGYLIANPSMTDQLLKLNQHLVTCAPTVLQHYVARHFDEIFSCTKPQISKLMEQRREVAGYLDELGLTYLPGAATFYFFVSIEESGLSSVDFCTRLLQDEKVSAVPGIGYGNSCDGYIRISVGTENPDRIREGIRRIRSTIDRARTGKAA